jgi:hypothetical protein
MGFSPSAAYATTGVASAAPISPSGQGGYYEATVASDPTNGQNLFAGAILGDCTNQVGVQGLSSSNGGSTYPWATSSPKVRQGSWGGDPALAFDSKGTPSFAYIDNPCPLVPKELAVSKWDKGANPPGWGPETPIDTQTNTYKPDKPMMAADTTASPYQDRVYVVYSQVTTTTWPLMEANSSNWTANGSTNVPVDASGHDTGGALDIAPSSGTLASPGALYVSWYDWNARKIRFAYSTDGGKTFPRVIDITQGQTVNQGVVDAATGNVNAYVMLNYDGNSIFDNTSMAVDRSGRQYNGQIYVVWNDEITPGGPLHIFLSVSNNQGSTWSTTPIQIDTGNPNNDAWQPSVSVDQSNGHVTVAWYDRRDDPANTQYNVYFTQSSDGGQTFLPQQVRVSPTPGNASPQFDTTKHGTGDYMGLAAACGSAHPVWVAQNGGSTSMSVWSAAVTDSQVGTTWSQELTAPTGRQLAAMAFDQHRNKLVLFGGTTDLAGGPSGTQNDTWLWDGCTWSKQPLQQNPTPPDPRLGAGMAYSDVLGEVVLFGGQNNLGVPLQDTWAWDGSKWNRLNPDPTKLPPAAVGVSLARDSATSNLVLYEVPPSKGTPVAQTWTFDGVNWSQPPNANTPLWRSFAGMSYDQGNNKVVLFGGVQNSKTPVFMNDTYLWNGSSWTKATNPPPANLTKRAYMGMDYDATLGVTVMSMGTTGSSPLSDTWYWNGANWTLQGSAAAPTRDGFTMSYFGPAGTMVLANGVDSTPKLLADSWQY